MACAKKPVIIGKAKIADRKFVPKYQRALTEKFYSKYEQIDSSVVLTSEDEKKMQSPLKRSRKEIFHAPVTENQVYGWYQHLADRFKMNTEDKGIALFGRKVDEQIEIMMQINNGLKRA